MTPEETFDAMLEGGAASDFATVYEAAGRSTRELADFFGVSIRTAQRWVKFEAGAGGEGRSWRRSPQAEAIRTMAQEIRLEDIPDEAEVDAEFDLEYVSDGTDEGARHAREVPIDNTEWKAALAAGDRAGAVQAWQAAILDGYGVTGVGFVAISSFDSFTMHT